ncbi:DUF2550 family protein [Lapillicoccus jejuensis]|uniref:Uncharacterized protein DUF2550 n=1 Tax=Lapillicoccus jejuensis TaxID=402171 RepID=A0A542E2R5_9MICO|nr:DUF2550 family protein [Lapillicoccus jejuensis]TQJ09628.1 uncharacterized protein DUF2550 [Lapillicoccus jejuensis]
MPAALLSVEVLVGALVVLVALVVVGLVLRRRALARGRILTLCGLRRGDATRFRMGLLRLGQDQLEWFPLLGVTLRPADGWARTEVDVETSRALPGPERPDLLPDAVGVACHTARGEFELALLPAHYTALRSWLESAPPGSRANVA